MGHLLWFFFFLVNSVRNSPDSGARPARISKYDHEMEGIRPVDTQKRVFWRIFQLPNINFSRNTKRFSSFGYQTRPLVVWLLQWVHLRNCREPSRSKDFPWILHHKGLPLRRKMWNFQFPFSSHLPNLKFFWVLHKNIFSFRRFRASKAVRRFLFAEILLSLCHFAPGGVIEETESIKRWSFFSSSVSFLFL